MRCLPLIATAARSRGADLGEILAVHGDEDVDQDLLAAEQDRPQLGLVAQAGGLDRLLVEHRALGFVEAVGPRALPTGQDRPHRQQGVGDQDGLGDDHHHPGQEVAAVARAEQELRVEQDAQGGDQRQQDHHGRVGIGRFRSAGDGHVFIDACIVVGRSGHGWTPQIRCLREHHARRCSVRLDWSVIDPIRA